MPPSGSERSRSRTSTGASELACRAELLSSFVPGQPTRALALARNVAVVLAGRRETPVLELYEVGTGALVSRVAVPRGSGSLSAAGRHVVFRVGKAIWLLDVTTRRKRVLARAAAIPLGLSLEGQRVAWAENIGRGGRIRMVSLPRE